MRATDNRPAWLLLTQHWLSLLGVGLLATAVISWLFVLSQQIRGLVDNPYVGIGVLLVLPAIFFTGLALVPIGIYLSKRHIRKGLPQAVFDRKLALLADGLVFRRASLDLTRKTASGLERQPRINPRSCHWSRVNFKMPSQESQSLLHAPNTDTALGRTIVHIKTASGISN